MGITTKKLYELFETRWLMQRQNPGGKSPYLQGYLLGFAGVINIKGALSSDTGTIKLKIGNSAVQTRSVDYSDVDTEFLSVEDAVLVLTEAGFTGCTFSVDADTGRLKLAPSAANPAKWIQIYGDLAAALGFGDCRYGEGKGCFLWASFNGDVKSIAETENWTEDKSIDNESPKGEVVKYTIPGRRNDTQIVVTDRLSSRMAKQMINGGRWIGGTADKPEIYEPPASSDMNVRRVDVFTYSDVFEKNQNTEGDEVFVRERMYIGCVGRQVNTGGEGSWKDAQYTLTATSYLDDEGKEHASPRESDYTRAQWDALGMSGILVEDWENA